MNIQNEVDQLKESIVDTQDLYREVCALLFFRHGITPTANKLYQYVRKGSMSAPAEALSRFWGDLREKSRVRIEHPDLPETLKNNAGELLGALWQQARQHAEQEWAACKLEAEQDIRAAQARAEQAQQQQSAAEEALRELKQQLQNTQAQALQLERHLASERAGTDFLSAQITSLKHQIELGDQALSEARTSFSDELEKLRDSMARSEERAQATEKRALLEIDRERTLNQKLQKELNQARTESNDWQQQALNTQTASEELRHRYAQQEQQLQKALDEAQRWREHSLNEKKHIGRIRKIRL